MRRPVFDAVEMCVYQAAETEDKKCGDKISDNVAEGLVNRVTTEAPVHSRYE